MENTAPNTNNFLNWVEIKNFKSIKDLRLDCKRVNVFIGKPNVGKSNILEGLGLLGAGYGINKFCGGFVRYEQLKHLFHDNDARQFIKIVTDKVVAELFDSTYELRDEPDFKYRLGDYSDYIRVKDMGDTYQYEQFKAKKMLRVSGNGVYEKICNDADEKEGSYSSLIKKYDFLNLTKFGNSFQEFLVPPEGPNLYEVIRRNPDLWDEFARLFLDQNLELVLYDQNQEIILQKKIGRIVWQYPFFSIADTFRRFMFYITAIESNKNSVLIFEEPEVHSFPALQKSGHRLSNDLQRRESVLCVDP